MTAVATSFLDSFQFVEPAGSQPVPNHLLDTKIYAKLSQNSVVKVSPPVIHFEGFEVGKPRSFKLSLCNVAREVIRMHIHPPQTKHFGLHYTKQMRLVPGMTLDCTVEFVADEWRYYYDCIKIHCPGDDNIVIPIHAYPAMDTSEFPQQITFPPTALGAARSKIIPLRSRVPVDFEFELTMLESNDAYKVEPLSGVVPANGEIDIAITFCPTTYATAVMILQLVVSQFNSKPRSCRIVGQCTPNINRAVEEIDDGAESASRVYSPLDRTRVRKQKTAAVNGKTFLEQFAKAEKVERDGLYFNHRLDTVHHVSQVLIQTPGKMQLKELLAETKTTNSRQLKETRFEQAVRKNVYEERQNQLRWQVNLGGEQMPIEEKARVLAEREAERQAYRDACGEPHASDELNRKSSELTWARTIRDGQQVSRVLEKDILFDVYSNNPWDIRHVACDRFAQAARKIIMRNRAKKNLSKLEHFVLEWRRRQMLGRKTKKRTTNKDAAATASAASDGSTATAAAAATTIADTPVDDDKVDESALKKYRVSINVNKVTHTKYPHYVQPNKKDDMAPDALSEVVTYPTEVETESDVPFFDLKVPQQYRLLGYEPHNVHDAYGYVAPSLPRRLRVGALDEVINLDTPVSVADEVASGRPEDTQQRLPPPSAAASGGQTAPAAAPRSEGALRGGAPALVKSAVVELKPPRAMFEPIEYPPLHIFNATPGLQVFQAPVPYSEVDPDFHLCPLPRYTASTDSLHSATQKKYLDREDVIKGVMSWKKFPSNGLVTLANSPTLTSVWVPRWTDPFDTELLPLGVPELQDGLAPEDALEYADESDAAAEERLLLTPEMVNAQFPQIAAQKAAASEEKESGDAFPFGAKMPATNLPVSPEGPVPRELREQELDYFLSKKSNKLGAKIQAKIEQYNGLKHDAELVLK